MDKVDKKKLTPLGFALKNNKTNIAELLIQLGAKEKAEATSDKKKKKGGKGSKEDSDKNDEKQENKIKNYVLVRIVDGEKKVLTSKEMEEFKKKYPDVADLLYNQKLIEELEANAPDAYFKIFIILI